LCVCTDAHANSDAQPYADADAEAVRDARPGDEAESELPTLRAVPAAGHARTAARIILDTQIERV
jgi:hypothetical protein